MSATAPPRPAATKGGGGGAARRPGAGPSSGPQAASAPPIPAAMPLSIVELCGKHSSRCGYCKGGAESKRAATKRTSVSFGLSTCRLLCQDYQALIDLGWRRSGTYMYRPVNEETCCPCYTIRLEVARFLPSRSQRQVAARLQRYLAAAAAATDPSGSNGKPSAAATAGGQALPHAGKKRQRPQQQQHQQPRSSDVSSVASGASAASGRSQQQLSPREAALVARLEKELKGAVRAALLAPPLADVAAAAGIHGGQQQGQEQEQALAALVSLVRVQRCGAGPQPQGGKKGGGDGMGSGSMGDYASPVALPLTAALRRRLQQQGGAAAAAAATPGPPIPQALASAVVAQLSLPEMEGEAMRVSVAGNGFINFFLPSSAPSTAPAPSKGEARRIPIAAVGTPTTASSSSSASLGEPMEEAGNGGSSNGSSGRGKGQPRVGEDVSQTVASSVVAVRRRGGKTEEGRGRQQQQQQQQRAGMGGEEEEEGEGSEMLVASVASTDDEGAGKPVSLAIAVAGSAAARRHGVVTVETVRPAVTEEVFALYKKYQVAVHGDRPAEVTREGFSRFLVQSPLVCYPPLPPAASPKSPGGGKGQDKEEADYRVPYGSYHQLYRLDGRLIAVGVVDILPACLSSVYCFYDPDFKQLSLGKLTALWEIDWVRQASRFRPGLRFYYLGFYIHTCPKMRYKGAYEPSELLCPVTLRWTPLADCRAILDRRPYARLAPPQDGEQVVVGMGEAAEEGVGEGARMQDEAQTQEQGAAAGADGGEGDAEDDDSGAEDEDESDYSDGDEAEEDEEEEDDDARFGLHVPLTEAEVGALEQVAMDVGPLAALPPRSQQILLPILREFVAHVTPALVPRLLIKLRH